MAEQVVMPKLGATMESGTILKWLKQEGDAITAGEPLVEIMTDKISMEIEAETSGTLLKICSKQDEDVPVYQVIAYIGKTGEPLGEIGENPEYSGLVPNAAGVGEADREIATPTNHDVQDARPRKTPAAKMLAEQHGIDLRLVRGSGPNGRIHRKDVASFFEQAQPRLKATPLARKIALENGIDLAEVKGSGANGNIVKEDVWPGERVIPKRGPEPEAEETIKLEGMRRLIAMKMVQSHTTVPHVTLFTEVDMTRCKSLRDELLPVIEKQTGCRLSYTEILLKFAAHTLGKHRMVNTSLVDDQIVVHRQVNIGFAVSVPQGLLVPVVRDVEKKSLTALTEECKRLAMLAREHRLRPDQLTGGTFTISNLGMYAVDSFTSIMNPPESAILGVGRIQEKAVGVGGSIELRPMMSLSLSFDHRVLDGAPAAAFLTDLKELLENPDYFFL